jgi:hypothetical protein
MTAADRSAVGDAETVAARPPARPAADPTSRSWRHRLGWVVVPVAIAVVATAAAWPRDVRHWSNICAMGRDLAQEFDITAESTTLSPEALESTMLPLFRRLDFDLLARDLPPSLAPEIAEGRAFQRRLDADGGRLTAPLTPEQLTALAVVLRAYGERCLS